MQSKPSLIASVVALPLALGGASALAGQLTGVPANPKVTGVTSPTIISPELAQVVAAQGSTPVENPGAVKYYGYLDDQPNLLPALGSNVEASKTEPDKNTYLVLHDLTGADPDYDYGTHFLFQGHESGSPGTLTRLNLDADAAHRVTVLANFETDGRRRCRRSTAPRGIPGRAGSCSARRATARRRAASGRRRRTTPRRSRAWSASWAGAATKACRRTRPGTSGSSRTSAAPRWPGRGFPTASSSGSLRRTGTT